MEYKELSVVDDLKSYLDIILGLDPISCFGETCNQNDSFIALDDELVLVGMTKRESDEVLRRESFKRFTEYGRRYFEANGKEIKFSALENQTNYFFRGQYDASMGLKTGVYRGGLYQKENYLYHEILSRCALEFRHTSPIEKLAIMQHYGCPTRLLDITANPLVALYFACKNYKCENCDKKEDGIVYIFSFWQEDIVYQDSDRAQILASLPRLSDDVKRDILRVILFCDINGQFEKENGIYTNDCIERLHHEISRELPSFKRDINPSDLLRPIVVQPEKTTDRILKQDGAFILTGLSSDGAEEQAKLESMLCNRIRIRNKDHILEQLEKVGITEASLFPNMEHVAKYLKKKAEMKVL